MNPPSPEKHVNTPSLPRNANANIPLKQPTMYGGPLGQVDSNSHALTIHPPSSLAFGNALVEKRRGHVLGGNCSQDSALAVALRAHHASTVARHDLIAAFNKLDVNDGRERGKLFDHILAIFDRRRRALNARKGVLVKVDALA